MEKENIEGNYLSSEISRRLDPIGIAHVRVHLRCDRQAELFGKFGMLPQKTSQQKKAGVIECRKY